MTTKKPAAASKSPAPKKAKATSKPTPKPPAPKAAKAPAAKQAKAPAAKQAKAPAAKQAKAPAAKQAKAPAAKATKATKSPAPTKAKATPTSPAPKETATAVDYDAMIARIEAKAAAAGVTLAKGASAKEIAATEKVLGAKLPDDVVAFYRRHDGTEDQPAVEGRELLSLARIVSEWKIWKDLLDQGTFEENDNGTPGIGVQKKWWIPEWVPVTFDGAGNHHVIDLAPAPGGIRGQVLSFWHDDDARTVVAKSFLEFLAGATWGDDEA
jgi:cell wall assembly regulator SMI1